MASLLRKGLISSGCLVLALGAVNVQSAIGQDSEGLPDGPQPYMPSSPQPYSPGQSAQTGLGYTTGTDTDYLRTALNSAKSGDGARIRTAIGSISDPLTRKIALWALADAAPDSMSFFEADAARRDLAGWPRGGKRQAAAEKSIESAGMTPDKVVAWFDGVPPQTPAGAMALAAALQAQGKRDKASDLIRSWWRSRSFELDAQRSMRARFGGFITEDDNIARTDLLLYGQQGPAAREMVSQLTGPYRAVAEARMALRSGQASGNTMAANLTPQQQTDPGLIYEQASFYRRKGLSSTAFNIARGFKPPPTEEAGSAIWKDQRGLIVNALQAGEVQAAYAAAANNGMRTGPDAAEAEFYAGWIALTKLKNPKLAERHFANLAAAGVSPITQGRALYWQGRTAEALGDQAAAQRYYRKGGEYITTFYGQLAAQKAGVQHIDLGRDPVITEADRQRFEGRETVKAARVLAGMGAKDTLRVFVLHIDDTLPTAAEEALLVDLALGYGDRDLAMRAVRTASQRGFNLPERGYPILTAPNVPGGAETAFVFSITRQESNFDPTARSGADARGMMQLLVPTGRSTARSLGESFTPDRLYEADFNMRLGARYLGDMVSTFGGSYLMAAAAYNAGPGRPTQWVATCGDPRGATTDPLDYIECIPFSETRNYVMRTLETMQVYRARMSGGKAPLDLAGDLKRGGWNSVGYTPTVTGTSYAPPPAGTVAPGTR